MKKNYLSIELSLPTTYVDTLHSIITDELKIAGKKWAVKLRADDEALIRKHALHQLERKVSDSIGTTWTITDELLTVAVVWQKPNKTLKLPNAEVHTKYSIITTREGWLLDTEEREDAVNIGDFYEHFLAKMEGWLRTAVLYGVGSWVQ